MRTSDEFEVAIAGAGPAGLSAAITLATHGVRTLLIELRTEPSQEPRATVASTGTMELLRRWGLEDEAWSRSLDLEWTAWACPTLVEADDGEAIEVGMPTRSQAALVSPSRPACLPQDELEPILERHLETLPSARIERGIELTAIEATPGGGHMLEVVGAGGRRRISARYLIGADGIRSAVRTALGIGTRGESHLESRVGVLFRGPLWPLVGDHRHGIYFIAGGSGDHAFIPAGLGDRWVFAIGAGREALDEARATDLILAAAGDRSLRIDVEHSAPVSFGTAVAERFREGDAFLVGDAAHRVTPRGGTGLNTAMRDGFDLGWKLAWVLRGWAGEQLLDSYEVERRPVAEHNAERSARPDGSILGTGLGLSADLGGRIPHVWVARGQTIVSTLDLLGTGLTRLVGPDWVGDAPRGPAPVSIEPLDAIAAHALGLSPSGSLLVRPDGRPVQLETATGPMAGGRQGVVGPRSR
jgi:2-polyprenyl-6-methoxyphenol hydroxylase-like FAD-dependent oxidoreductase